MNRTLRPRSAFSLLELVAVVALLGILAAAAIASYSRGSLGNVGARADATRLATGIALTRRQAIATGTNHVLAFVRSGGVITGFQVSRRQGGSLIAVGSPVDFHRDVVVTAAADVEFNFQGEGLAAYTVQLNGGQHVWRVTINQITGAATIARVS